MADSLFSGKLADDTLNFMASVFDKSLPKNTQSLFGQKDPEKSDAKATNTVTSTLPESSKTVPVVNALQLSPKEQLDMAEAAAGRASNQNYSAQTSAARVGAALSQESYRDKVNADSNARLTELRAADDLKPKTTTFITDKTKYDIAGRNLADVANQQDAANLMREQFQNALTSADRNRYNQQLLASTDYQSQSNLQRAQQASAQELAKIQASAQVAAAGLGAQGSILGSLFGSIGSGSPNYKYW